MLGQYQNCFARLYDLSAPVWYWCSWFRSAFLSGLGMIIEWLLWIITSPHSVSWIDIFSHMVEYSHAGFVVGICFGSLYVLIAFISSLYSSSVLAACIIFAVERSSVSWPAALLTLIFACFGCGFTRTCVYLSMYCGGVFCVLDDSLLSASANVLLSACMCCTLMLYGVMLSSSLSSLLFVTSARSLFSMFMSAL